MGDVKAKSLGIPGVSDQFIKFSLLRFSSSDVTLAITSKERRKNIDLDCIFSSKQCYS